MLSNDVFLNEMKKIDNGTELVAYDENNNKLDLKQKLNEISMFLVFYTNNISTTKIIIVRSMIYI